MKFAKFTEKNEWEGETWRFWLQVDGNEAELTVLNATLLKVAALYDGDDPPFMLSPTYRAERYVDFLIEQAEEDEDGYMASDHKITGKLTVPDWPDPGPEEYDNAIERALYKGGIAKLFRKTADA